MQQNKLRTKETYKRYQNDRLTTDTQAKTLDNPEDIVVKEYTYWKIIQNNYPYDAVSSKHDMLIPKRIFGTLDDATEAERVEYQEIIASINEEG